MEIPVRGRDLLTTLIVTTMLALMRPDPSSKATPTRAAPARAGPRRAPSCANDNLPGAHMRVTPAAVSIMARSCRSIRMRAAQNLAAADPQLAARELGDMLDGCEACGLCPGL